jgi:nitrite reductase (NADH) small subunit
VSRTLVEHRLGPLAAIPPNEGRTVRVGEHAVAVFHLRDGGVRAVQASCPHRGGPLADGLVGRRTLVCPLHGRVFDLDTGTATAGEVGIATYPARVDEDGTVVLALPEGEPPACFTDEERC